MNNWFDAIVNPQQPASTNSDEEFAKYDFAKSAGQALGGGSVVTQAKEGSAPSPKPAVTGKPKKKKVAGGC